MAKKTIKVALTVESIDRAIHEIEQRRKEIESKVDQIIDAMLVAGENYAIATVGHVDTGATMSSIHGYRNGKKGVIVAGGAAIWIEFGTGVIRNKQPHPKANELGMAKWGTYGKGHGADPNGWWYYDENGEKHHTRGIESNRFMYQTAEYLKQHFPQYAIEVFSK